MAPAKKNPIPKVRQIKKEIQKTKFSLTDENLFEQIYIQRIFLVLF